MIFPQKSLHVVGFPSPENFSRRIACREADDWSTAFALRAMDR
jgi:hypothetical protein